MCRDRAKRLRVRRSAHCTENSYHAFAGLKRGARAAEDGGARGLFTARVDQAAKPKSKPRATKAKKDGSGEQPGGPAWNTE